PDEHPGGGWLTLLDRQPIRPNWLGDVFQRLEAHVLRIELAAKPLSRLLADDDASALAERGEARGDVGRWARGGVGPSRAGHTLDLGCAHGGDSGIDPYVHRDGLEVALEGCVGLPGTTLDPEGREHGGRRVAAGIRVPEDHHEAIPGRLVHVASELEDLVQESAEVDLNELGDAV